MAIYIHVWASALLVSTRLGNARRQDRGTSNRYSNPHFFVLCTKESRTRNRLAWGSCEAHKVVSMPDNNVNEYVNATPVNGTPTQPQFKKSFCKYCGSEMQNGAAFCPSCGKQQISMPQQQGARPIPQQPQQFYGQPMQQPAYMAGAYQQPPQAAVSGSTQNSSTTVIVQGGRSNGMGTAGFVFAILAFFVCWVPIVDIIVWFLGALFSFIGLFKAPRGLAIAGFILSFLGIIILLTFLGALIGFAGR